MCCRAWPTPAPPKWHLAHTTWFFDRFLLQEYLKDYPGCDPIWNYQFSSYYEAVGDRHPRPQRGMLSRPAIGEILAWRQQVDEALAQLLKSETLRFSPLRNWNTTTSSNTRGSADGHPGRILASALEPVYAANAELTTLLRGDGRNGWPVTADWWTSATQTTAFTSTTRPPTSGLAGTVRAEVTTGQQCRIPPFMADGGYRRPDLWMSEGWAMRQQQVGSTGTGEGLEPARHGKRSSPSPDDGS